MDQGHLWSLRGSFWQGYQTHISRWTQDWLFWTWAIYEEPRGRWKVRASAFKKLPSYLKFLLGLSCEIQEIPWGWPQNCSRRLWVITSYFEQTFRHQGQVWSKQATVGFPEFDQARPENRSVDVPRRVPGPDPQSCSNQIQRESQMEEERIA